MFANRIGDKKLPYLGFDSESYFYKNFFYRLFSEIFSIRKKMHEFWLNLLTFVHVCSTHCVLKSKLFVTLFQEIKSLFKFKTCVFSSIQIPSKLI